ncbi:hypothetical protein [Streptomyces sp. NBC_01353]|uniref:hypothetical protein n=1 Tax=Streptomyces sp. NBC_01353 TaxID=2903835 RepID=UPI002E309286|nr:hypothetical protein [Streptomyces sp. NBC_01353]
MGDEAARDGNGADGWISEVVYDQDGRVLIPASDLLGILRRFAQHWSEGAALGGLRCSPAVGDVQLDPVTLITLAGEFEDLADKMDRVLMSARPDQSDS